MHRILLLVLVALLVVVVQAADNRYSFSLTTFDPQGRLGQVDRAGEAAAKGPPIVLLRDKDRIIGASPQILPTPFVLDDGTSRFVPLTQDIFVAHTGVSVDGRKLTQKAQHIAVNHEYTYDESIPVGVLLEELSIVYQKQTQEAGSRPWGAVLVVGYVPEEGDVQIFRIDPSGAVTELSGDCVVINGARLGDFEATKEPSELAAQLKSSFLEQQRRLGDESNVAILTASLSRSGTFQRARHT